LRIEKQNPKANTGKADILAWWGAAMLRPYEEFGLGGVCAQQKLLSVKGFLDLRGYLESERIEALREIANILQELIIEDNGGDGGEESGGGGDQSFSDAGCYGAEAGSTGAAEAGEGVNDAPDGAEKADEGGDGTRGGQPGHAFFDPTDFLGRSELHIHGDGVETFELASGLRVADADLALQLAIAGGVDRSEGRTGRSQSLRVGDATGGAKDAEELVAVATDAAEQPELLEDQSPGNDGEGEKNQKNAARDPTCLLENAKNVGDEEGGQRKSDVSPSVGEIFAP